MHKKPAVRAKTYEETYKASVDIYLIPYFGKAELSDILPSDIAAFFNRMSENEFMMNGAHCPKAKKNRCGTFVKNIVLDLR